MQSTVSPARRRLTALIGASILALAAATAWASHGGSFIDLTADGTQIEHNDALLTQGGVGAGTGNFDPYLTLSPGGSTPTESGYNICSEPVFGFDDDPLTPEPPVDCPDPQFDELTGGDRTHELLASVIPVNTVGGTDYREFFLDSNDTGAEPFMSIEVIKLFLDDQPDLTDYDPGTESFDNDTGSAATVTWDLDGDGDQTILLNTQGLESGSGVSDISVLVPDDLFPADCFYGSTTCDTYVIFYTEAGGAGVIGDRNYGTTAGFEEWRIELLPVVNVQKDVDVSLTRSFPWDVTKTADVETIDLFAGDTASIDWTVTATVGAPVESDLTVSGEIDILNPTGTGFAIEGIPATVIDVDDVLTLGGLDTTADVTCPGGLPQDLDPGDTLTCTYTSSPTSATDGTNTATVTIETNEEGDTQEYEDTATVDFDLATANEVDECVEVTDDNTTPADLTDDTVLDAELCEDESPGVYNFSTDVGPFTVEDCGSTTITNTAHTETNDTATPDSASDSVDVACHELTVTKDANASFSRDYDWTVEKTRVFATGEVDGDLDPLTLTLDPDQTYTLTYEITVDLATIPFTDSGWAVAGTITIDNPAPIAADDVAVSDEVSGVGAADVDCDDVAPGLQSTVDIAAEDSATCTYALDLPDGTNRTNTATATLFEVDYTGTADVDFSTADVSEIDECVVVTDDNGTPLDVTDDTILDAELCASDAPETYTNTIDVGPFAECGEFTFTNTAHIVAIDDDNDTGESHSASYTVSITVPCPEGCTLTQGYWKTHNESFTGGAPVDPNWFLLGDVDLDGNSEGEDEAFFGTGQTWFEAFWSPVSGRPYYQLAHQYMAAVLNKLSIEAEGGSIPTTVQDAIDDAAVFLDANDLNKDLKGKDAKALRTTAVTLAGILGSFNEGTFPGGPLHCDEDGSSAAVVLPPLLPVRRRRLA
jgi:hypothetical protein